MKTPAIITTLILAAACCVSSFAAPDAQKPRDTAPKKQANKIERLLADRVQLYGHRNWIAIVDSAYPAQTAAGIETIVVGGDQIETVNKVLAALKKAKHVRPLIYVDRELAAVPEKYAPGITEYRNTLDAIFADGKNVAPSKLPHEQIIHKLDEASRTFKVLILKTDMTLPYTSVFIELDCGYWSAEAEAALRAALK